ncbi:alpha/beta hydrolase [Celerinatantimonas yamalensis]|uniref:Alpha/beta hydrolase n=1 Tax=Celerinatantimonas yamalensis TaxID=559956 RepID=A0ABW9GBT1_9GAMM
MNHIPTSIQLGSDQAQASSQEYFQDGRYYATNQPYLETYEALENPTHGAVLIFPGGGLKTLAWANEGQAIAKWVNQALKLSAFVVHYRLSPYVYPLPQYDARQALRIVRSYADQWHLNPNAIGVMGFSIGGHLALQLAIAPTSIPESDGELSHISARPNWGIVGYSVSTMNSDLAHESSTTTLFGGQPSLKQQQLCDLPMQIGAQTPPLFIFHELNDPAVPAAQSLRLMQHLHPVSQNSELHMYQGDKHGVGLATDEPGNVHTWPLAAQQWLQNNRLI